MTSYSQRITELVEALLEAGCDMWAVGSGYYIGEPPGGPDAVKVQAILKAFGPRHHLTPAISAYLKSIGRDIEVDGPE